MALRDQSPLTHCLTNIVAAPFVANVLLAAGAAVAMVDNEHEAQAFAGVASGVLVNLGTPYEETVAAMRAAVRGAAEQGTPWVLDPVGAGGLPWRTQVARELVGSAAAETAAESSAGPGTFAPALLDQLCLLTPSDLGGRVEPRCASPSVPTPVRGPSTCACTWSRTPR